MALSELEQKLWNNNLLERFDVQSGWNQLIDDRTAEMGNAKQLAIFKTSGTVVVRDYSDTVDIPIPQRVGVDDVILTMNKFKVVAAASRDLEEAWTDINLLGEAAGRAAIELVDQYNKDLYATVVAEAHTDNDVGDANTRTTISVITDTGTVAANTNEAKFNSLGYREKIIEALLEAPGRMRVAGQPTENLAVVMPYRVLEQIAKYFIIDKGTVGTGVINDAAWMSGMIRNMFGLELAWDKTNTGDSSSAGTDQFPVYVFPRGNGLAAAYRVVRTRELDVDRTNFNQEVQSLVIYGSKITDPSLFYNIRHTFVTT